MTHGRIAALGVSGALALGLAACGGSSSSGGGATNAAAPSASGSTQAAPAQTTSAAEAPAASGGLTAPGTHLDFGQQANVGWVPPAQYDADGGQSGFKLQISVDAIERGTIDDFKNIQLTAEQRASTPYYVRVTVKSLDDITRIGTDDPDISFDAIDDRDQQQGSVTFFGDFPRCDDTQVPKPFPNGKSYSSCLTYLIAGGGSIQSVQWRAGPSRPNEVTPYFDKPIVWGGN